MQVWRSGWSRAREEDNGHVSILTSSRIDIQIPTIRLLDFWCSDPLLLEKYHYYRPLVWCAASRDNPNSCRVVEQAPAKSHPKILTFVILGSGFPSWKFQINMALDFVDLPDSRSSRSRYGFRFYYTFSAFPGTATPYSAEARFAYRKSLGEPPFWAKRKQQRLGNGCPVDYVPTRPIANSWSQHIPHDSTSVIRDVQPRPSPRIWQS